MHSMHSFTCNNHSSGQQNNHSSRPRRRHHRHRHNYYKQHEHPNLQKNDTDTKCCWLWLAKFVMVMLTCVTAVGLAGAALIPACTARAIAHEQMQNGGNVPWHRTRSLCRPLSATQSPYQIIYSLFFLSLPGVRASPSLCIHVCLSLYLSFSTLNSLFLFHRLSFFFLCVTSLSSFFLSPLL